MEMSLRSSAADDDEDEYPQYDNEAEEEMGWLFALQLGLIGVHNEDDEVDDEEDEEKDNDDDDKCEDEDDSIDNEMGAPVGGSGGGGDESDVDKQEEED